MSLRIVAVLTVTFAVAATPVAAQNEQTGPEASTPSGAAPADAPTAVPESGWQQEVDDFFGKYIVDPLTAVLFFDFGTEKWLGANVPFVVVWLLGGAVFFTIRMNFINVRGFWHALRLTKGDFDKPGETGEVSHFQALSSALSATVGLGNIAGVAIAVATGGPGAIVWMMIVGILGMSSKFTECSLGQMYRKVAPDGTVSGGPMHYLADGLAEMGMRPLGVVLAVVFGIMCILASFGGGCAFQVGQSMNAIQGQLREAGFTLLDTQSWIYGAVMAALVGVVIIGGIRRIAATASKIVPLMCGIYVLMALWVLGVNYQEIPGAFATMFSAAFGGGEGGVLTPVMGGFLGIMVIGVQRAAFSNEAGCGSASIAHSAAKTDEPVSEGIVALLEPFIDTVVVCTMTGLVIVITRVYSDPANEALITGDQGAALTASALGGVVSWFPWVLALAVILFAYSTMISWSYYGERCWTHLFGERTSIIYRILFLIFVLLGSIVTAGQVLVFSTILILAMALPNILGVAILSGKVRRRLDDYWRRYEAGEMKIAAGAQSAAEAPAK